MNNKSVTLKKRPIPPYLPYSSLRNFLTGLREHGLPARIDRSLMHGLSGTTQSWLVNALRFLKLVDETSDDTPTQFLRDLASASASEADHANTLAQITRTSYAAFLPPEFDLGKATLKQLQEKFRERGATGTTVSKCLSFFLALCEEAEIDVSPHCKRHATRTRVNGGGSKRRTTARTKPEPDPKPDASLVKKPADIPAIQDDLLLGLVKRLPEPGALFHQKERDQWFVLARAIFDSIYQAADKSEEET